MADVAGGVIDITVIHELPDNRWAANIALEAECATQELEDNRWSGYVVDTAMSGTRYLMGALATADSTPVVWTSYGQPDTTGAGAGRPVQVSTIGVLKKIS